MKKKKKKRNLTIAYCVKLSALAIVIKRQFFLRTFARNLSSRWSFFIFFTAVKSGNELFVSEINKKWGSRTSFQR